MNTWADIKSTFEDILADSGNAFISDATQVRWANAALRELCEAARYIEAQKVSNVASGVSQYAVTEGGYSVVRVEYDGEALFPIYRSHLRQCMRDFSGHTGLPRFYFLDEINATPDNLYVGVYETPSANLTNGLRIWYHGYPAAVSDSSPSTEIEIPDWAVGGVLFYMLREAYTADTNVRNLDTAAFYGMLYDDVLDRLVSRSRSRLAKSWQSGQRAYQPQSILNRLPDRVPAP